ncbi:MAG: PAS domain S-box protein, partial [Bacteroidetes bacterium]
MDHKDKTNKELIEKISELQIENERLRAQIKNSLSENQLKLILENAGEGILGLDLNGNHTFVNPKASLLLGYQAAEMIGKRSHSMWHHHFADGSPFPDEKCPIYFTLKDGKTHEGESYFWRKDGTGFYVDFFSFPIFDNGLVIGAVVTFFDITARKRTEEALTQERDLM